MCGMCAQSSPSLLAQQPTPMTASSVVVQRKYFPLRRPGGPGTLIRMRATPHASALPDANDNVLYHSLLGLASGKWFWCHLSEMATLYVPVKILDISNASSGGIKTTRKEQSFARRGKAVVITVRLAPVCPPATAPQTNTSL